MLIQVVVSGIDRFETPTGRFAAQPGDFVVLNPYEVHTGMPGDDRSLQYFACYLERSHLKDLAGSEALHFDRSVIKSGQLSQNIQSAIDALSKDPDDNRAGVILADSLRDLLLSHAVTPSKTGKDHQPLRNARRFLIENYRETFSTIVLAREVGLSPFHLIRSFRSKYGLAPHDFQLNLRVEAAKHMMRRGTPPAKAAYELGFADQSHFTRIFKRIVGAPPGAYLG